MNYTYSDELYHYGIPGMRWGVRKNREDYYNQRARSAQAKANAHYKAGHRFRGNFYNDISADYKYMSKTSARLSKTKGLKNRIITKYGNQANADYKRTQASKFDKRAKNSKLKINKMAYAADAYNARSEANVYQSTANAKGMSNKINTYVKGAFTMPTRTISGREMSSGRMAVEQVLASSVAGPAGVYAQQLIPPRRKK